MIILAQLQNQVNILQGQSAQETTDINIGYMDQGAGTDHEKNYFKVSKPETFDWSNRQCWIHCLEHVFVNEGRELADQENVQYALGYLKDAGTQ